MSIQASQPDFVLSVLYPQENGSATRQADLDFKRLVQTLHDNGFSSQVRPGDNQTLLVFVKLGKKYAELAEYDVIKNYEFGVTARNESQADRTRVIYQYLTFGTEVGGVGITPAKDNWDFVTAIVPVAGALDDVPVTEKIKQVFTESKLNTSSIKEKYGVAVALYFEFVKFYSGWLIYLSVYGILSYFKAKKTYSLTYAFVNLIWGVLFITFWSRKQSYLVNFWGVQNSHFVEEFNSKLALLNASKESYKGNASGVRYAKQLAFVPVALGFTAVLVGYQLACFVLEIFLSEIYDGPGKIFLTLLPTILLAVFVPILTIVYNLVTNAVIAWENHDNVYSRRNSVVIKTFVLNFLTGYVPLIITSFIYLPFAHLIEPHLGDIQATLATNFNQSHFYYKYITQLKKQENFVINQERLNAQFFYFIVTNQVVQLVLKFVLPLVISNGIAFAKSILSGAKQTPIEDNESEKEWLTKVRKSIALPEYNVGDDFRAVILQYGYLILFGPVWPLAPVVSIVFNLLTFKLDLLKLGSGLYFRPTVQARVDSIHPWDYALFLLTWAGSVISPIVTALYRHGTKPPKTLGQLSLNNASTNISSTAQLVIILFVSENGFLVLYYTLSKLSKLFKSEVELKNDFVDNDIKLRRDYYSGKVKPNLTASSNNGNDWTDSTVEKTILEARAIPSEPVTETIPETSQGYSTSTDDARKRAFEEKSKQLKEKQAELEEAHKKELEKIKDKSDRIISSKGSDNLNHFSTIDSNEHIHEDESESADVGDDKKYESGKKGAKENGKKEQSEDEEKSYDEDEEKSEDGLAKKAKQTASEFKENPKEKTKQLKEDAQDGTLKEKVKKVATDAKKDFNTSEIKKDFKDIGDDNGSVNSKVSRSKSVVKKLFKSKK